MSSQQENEDKIIIKYILELKNEEKRLESLKNLYTYVKYTKKPKEKIAVYIWFSGGTMAIFLQELINLYKYLSPANSKTLTGEIANKAIYILYFFQCLSYNPLTKKELLSSEILTYIFPLLSFPANSKKSYLIKISALTILCSLAYKCDSETFNFFKNNDLMPKILRIMNEGKKIDKDLACHIIQKLITNFIGLEYICEVKERLEALCVTLKNILISDNDSLKLKKTVVKILIILCENNKEAKNAIKNKLLDEIKIIEKKKNLDENFKNKIEILIKTIGNSDNKDINDSNKINKLTIGSMNNNNPNKKNNSNNNKNKKETNMSNSNENKTKLNLNMMFINNMNQIKMPNGYMIPNVDNYNLNNDYENYRNNNIYNQNGNNFTNINYYNSFKNK
jgi:hypothetical protein